MKGYLIINQEGRFLDKDYMHWNQELTLPKDVNFVRDYVFTESEYERLLSIGFEYTIYVQETEVKHGVIEYYVGEETAVHPKKITTVLRCDTIDLTYKGVTISMTGKDFFTLVGLPDISTDSVSRMTAEEFFSSLQLRLEILNGTK